MDLQDWDVRKAHVVLYVVRGSYCHRTHTRITPDGVPRIVECPGFFRHRNAPTL